MRYLYKIFIMSIALNCCASDSSNDIQIKILDDDSTSRLETAFLQEDFYDQLAIVILAVPQCFVIEYYNVRLDVVECKRLELPALPKTLPIIHAQHYERANQIEKTKKHRNNRLKTFFSSILNMPRPQPKEKNYTYLNRTLLHVLPSLNDTTSEYAKRFLFINTDLEDDTEYSTKQTLSETVIHEINSATNNGVHIMVFTETNRQVYDSLGLSNHIQWLSHPDEFTRKLKKTLTQSSSLISQN